MFFIIQSNNTDRLVSHLIDFYKKNQGRGDLASLIFTPFTIIVPSMVLGDWLHKVVATRVGISTLFTAEFWGKYQWDMMKVVIELDGRANPSQALAVPEVAVLSASIMRWRIFGFVMEQFGRDKEALLNDDDNPLSFLIKPLYDEGAGELPEHRLWQACDELSRVYVRYLTHRPEWLTAWAKGQSLQESVKKMMSDKARLDEMFGGFRSGDERYDTPEWLTEHYLNLEKLLHFLWWRLFGETYHYRLALEHRFWQVLKGERDQEDKLSVQAREALPKSLYLFTVQQIPQVELNFLKELSQYLDIVLLHFNPSMMFWADIVDRQWLANQTLIRPQMVYLKDYGHGLLSRLGKESRDTFAMLADMSGGADSGHWQITWQDDFEENDGGAKSLLNGLKSDILMLSKEGVTSQELWHKLLSDDNLTQKPRPKTPLVMDEMGSLSIHACHSLKRQLELARLMIAKYLNENPARTLADVVVLLPDVAVSEDMIRSVFPEGRGVDGLYLPIRVTGTPDKSIDELMRAISGFYTLLGEPTSRFYADEVYEWLLTSALYESFGLSFDQMRRGVVLLTEAGFKRGFDEWHLTQYLHAYDSDYRYTFSYALDRLVLGLLAPAETASSALYPFAWHEGVFHEATLPLSGVMLSDEPIINALTTIHAGLLAHRGMLTSVDNVAVLLNHIEEKVINRYFAHFQDSVALRAIFNAKNAMNASLRANANYHRNLKVGGDVVASEQRKDDIRLSMKFVLESLTELVSAQAISAEPSDVITFARFGAVRSIPFGLTVMLDMNLSAFPRQDKSMRLDLMRAGVKRLGDRYNEDDDRGAFLDALLCTRERCLIFYQGMSADGENKLLPASVVSELIEFLKTEARWQELQDEKTAKVLNNIMPALIEKYLITYHEPTFFDKAVYYKNDDNDDIKPTDETEDLENQLKRHFNDKINAIKLVQKQSLPPPPLWQNIRQILDNPHKTHQTIKMWDYQSICELSTLLEQSFSCQNDKALTLHIHQLCIKYGITLPKSIHVNELIAGFKNLAKTYLKDKVKIDKKTDIDEINEPLTLDNLGEYHLKELFLNVAQANLVKNQSSLNELLQTHNGNDDPKNISTLNKIKSLYYNNLLPAGQLRLATPDEFFVGMNEQITEFYEGIELLKQHQVFNQQLQNTSCHITTITERQLTLHGDDIHMTITAIMPDEQESVWLNILPNTARAEHLFRFFVHHVLWQANHVEDKCSLWQFNKAGSDLSFSGVKLFAIKGISPLSAKAYLYNLIILLNIAKQTPIIMTHREGFNYVHQKNNADFQLNRKLFASWLGGAYSHDIYDDNSRHELWQVLLQELDPYVALKIHLPMTAPLYALMNEYLLPITLKNHENK